MRLGVFAVILSVLIAGGACGSSSAEGIFSNGGTGGSGASNGGSASGTGGVFGTGGDGGSSGSFGTGATGGEIGSGGSGAGGTGFDADTDVGVGGTADSGPEPDSGSIGSGGTNGASGAGGSDGTVCAGNQCDPDRRCCFPLNGSPYCTAPGGECECAGIGCSSTIMTCDEQSDCTNGETCCAIVAYGLGSARVSHVRCQPSCSTPLVEFVICDPNGPDICTGQTNCSQGILLSAVNVCQ